MESLRHPLGLLGSLWLPVGLLGTPWGELYGFTKENGYPMGTQRSSRGQLYVLLEKNGHPRANYTYLTRKIATQWEHKIRHRGGIGVLITVDGKRLQPIAVALIVVRLNKRGFGGDRAAVRQDCSASGP